MPRPTRPILEPLSFDQALRDKVLRPEQNAWQKARNAQIDLIKFRHLAEEFGGGIGIMLHWLVVKPMQLLIYLFWESLAILQQGMQIIATLLFTILLALLVTTVYLFYISMTGT
jgi:hypothetical protein